MTDKTDPVPGNFFVFVDTTDVEAMQTLFAYINTHHKSIKITLVEPGTEFARDVADALVLS
jgi:hypothetical protein